MFSSIKAANVKTPKVIVFLLLNSIKVGFLLLIVCFAYTLFALLESSVEKTRISDDALLPGLVDETFNDVSVITNYAKQLKNKVQNYKILTNYLSTELNNLRIEVGVQNFSVKPSTILKANSAENFGINVYGIVRAVRSPPFESILIVVQSGKKHISSMAFSLALAKHAKKQIYWARDLVFLFVKNEKLAIEAWMSAFYGYKHNYLITHELKVRSGPPIGAFVLDYSGVDENMLYANSINIQYGMINGRLPNLDLVNLFILLTEKHGTVPYIYNVEIPHYNHYDYKTAIITFLRSIVFQSFVELENIHSVIGGYGVNTVTIRARCVSQKSDSDEIKTNWPSLLLQNKKEMKKNYIHFLDLARIAEGGMRSLNNILQKFHRSYFFYILPHTHKFISVAFYMPIIGLLTAPFLLFAFQNWFSLMYGEDYFKKIIKLNAENYVENNKHKFYCDLSETIIFDTFFVFFCTHLISLIYYATLILLYTATSASWVSKFSLLTNNWLSSSLNLSLLTILLPLLVISPFTIYFGKPKNLVQYYLMRFLISCELALFISALSLLNFALAFCLGILIVPFSFFVLASNRKTSMLKKFIGFTVLNPINLAIFFSIVLEQQNILSFGGISTFGLNNAKIVFKSLLKWVTYTIKNHIVHESALFPILAIFCLSIFNIFMQTFIYENFTEEFVEVSNTEINKDNFVNKNKEEIDELS